MNIDEFKKKHNLTMDDVQDIEAHGLAPDDIEKQIEQLNKGTEYVELVKPCSLEDGITKIAKSSYDELMNLQSRAAANGEFLKFVPASGAASRMFKKLEEFMNSEKEISDADEDVKAFFEKLDQFAFYDDLKRMIESKDASIKELLINKKHKEVLRYLLTNEGINYSSLPKALIKFHSYDGANVNALEEQVFEASKYIQDKDSKIRLHFTIPPELEAEFQQERERIIRKFFQDGIEVEINFSFQKKSTDTIALDKDGNLFRENGKILFRPGGHGALIENLNDLEDDLVYIKNIDNVQREEMLSEVVVYKKLIGGMLLKLRNKIYNYLLLLENSTEETPFDEIEDFIKKDLSMKIKLNELTESEKREKLIQLLNRPIRVCGVVINEGHPGGGPFWVKEKDGRVTRQIIESAQVDMEDEEQKTIFESSTHFNPVDLVCGLSDYKGNKFELTNYVDHSAVFVADKSKGGKDLKALELPGLWNGAMSDWITIFVEVPKETFTPVKEVNDLLSKYHQ